MSEKKIVPKKKPAAKKKPVGKSTNNPGKQDMVVKTKTELVAMSSIDKILQMAADPAFEPAKVEMMVNLLNAQDAKRKEEAFDLHFSEMIKDFVPIKKVRSAKGTDGKEMYSFAGLGDIQKAVQSIMGEHGFSVSWTEEDLDTNRIRVTCIIKGWGHKRLHPIEVAVEPPGKRTNATQMRGVASTYGRRYSFIGAIPVILEDEDSDGIDLTYSDGAAYGDHTEKIMNCKTRPALSACVKKILDEIGTDLRGRDVIQAAYKEAKKMIDGEVS